MESISDRCHINMKHKNKGSKENKSTCIPNYIMSLLNICHTKFNNIKLKQNTFQKALHIFFWFL